MSKSQKSWILLPSVQHNSCPQFLVDSSNVYTDYMWIKCANFGVCFQFPTLLVFEICVTPKLGNWKNVKNVICLNRFPDPYIRLIYFEILLIRNLETCLYPHVFFFPIFYLSYLSRYKLSKSVTVGQGWDGLGRVWLGRVRPVHCYKLLCWP